MQNAYWRTNISGLPFLFMTLEFNPTDSIINWSTNTLASFPDDSVVLVTHDYLTQNGARSVAGSGLWTRLVSQVPNVVMVLSGHWGLPGSARMLPPCTNNYGRIVNELYLNYQFAEFGDPRYSGDGRRSEVARLMIIAPLLNQVSVQQYDCKNHSWLTLQEDNFVMPLFQLVE
jgi:hypothetical protein